MVGQIYLISESTGISISLFLCSTLYQFSTIMPCVIQAYRCFGGGRVAPTPTTRYFVATHVATTWSRSVATWLTCDLHQKHLINSCEHRCRSGNNEIPVRSLEGDVLEALSTIIDPDFGMNIVDCGFVKDLVIESDTNRVSFTLELTTPACPIKEEFEKSARAVVSGIDWVKEVNVKMDAQHVSPLTPDEQRPNGLKQVKHVIAVSSCKGGVGKSTTAVNLAYTLAQMGAKVGIFDADVYGPSLPTMINPEVRVLQMDAETKAITPVEYEGVKGVSFGFAGQGSAIMRGPMVSGLIEQLLLTTEWGELDYLLVDFPPGTGDIQLTLCQSVAFTAAVVVTTPQNLAFVDVAKGIKMFARMEVPCVAVAENMSYFDGDDGKRYQPFGRGSGDRIQQDFGIPHLIQFPIDPMLSSAGDVGQPLVVSDPTGKTSQVFQDLGACVVREAAKLAKVAKNACRYDRELRAFVIKPPAVHEDQSYEYYLDPATVRRNDTSAASINEWTGEKILADNEVSDFIEPVDIRPVGNYAIQISWDSGFNQVASFQLLSSLPRLTQQELLERKKSPVPHLD